MVIFESSSLYVFELLHQVNKVEQKEKEMQTVVETGRKRFAN